MKKVISILLVMAIGITLFASGCGQKPEQTEKTTTEKPQPIIMKIATATTGDTQAQSLEELKKVIEKNSQGRIEVQTYPSGRMGSNEQQHQGLLAGSIQAIVEPSAFMGGFLNGMGVIDLPYMFPDVYSVGTLLQGPAGDSLRKYCESKGITIGRIYSVGPRRIITRFPVEKLEDLKGKKIRTGSKALQDQWAALGAVGVPMGVAELYTALQQGTVDGLESTVSFFYTGKYYEVAKYLWDENLGAQTSIVLYNKAWLDSLPADLRQICLDACEEIAEWDERSWREVQTSAIEEMKKTGVKVTYSSPEFHEKCMELTLPVHEKFINDYPEVKPIYDDIVKALKEQQK